ncbi:MAG: hypothetical protein HGB18_02525 [Candidatus Moranbacteria bacterium]|nr:hypothetical protein [Candidatus Moranbacteria bacterium]
MDRKQLLITVASVGALALVLSAVLASVPAFRDLGRGTLSGSYGSGERSLRRGAVALGTFSSADEFRRFLEAGGSSSGSVGFGGGVRETALLAQPAVVSKDSVSASAPSAPRVSETNVRTEGVDEPDIVKTDGKRIFYSREPQYLFRGGPEPIPAPMMDVQGGAASSIGVSAPSDAKIGIVPPFYQSVARTDIFGIDGFDVSKLGSFEKGGETLLFGQTLVLFESSGRSVIGYDVSDPTEPKEKWTLPIGDDGMLLEARKTGDRLYLVERSMVNRAVPCPFRPFGAGSAEVACTDIRHPETPFPADAVYTLASVDPATGVVGGRTSFVGSSGQSVVYMGPDNLYVTYPKPVDTVPFLIAFLRESGAGLFSMGLLDRLERLDGYDIGPEAKTAEVSRLLSDEYAGRSQDDRLALETDVSNRLADYVKRHLRDLGSTGIVKVSLDGPSVSGSGSVPGTPLNDFSLDEYDGHLRIATTVGMDGGWFASGVSLPSGSSTENDLYVLDGDLRQIGSLQGLGSGERIYSARFIGDRGYLVTFRQTDPFYVLDLSDPKQPEKTGELKIPGYSSYLHPLGDHLVLGIGQEDGRVKLSLFDASDPKEPKEPSKYLLDEYWSEAMNDRNAFLADPEHRIFFLPGGKGGYVVSYDGGTLSLRKAVAGDGIRRALYVGDAFFMVGDSAIVSFDENTWQEKGRLDIAR